jgi:hypothetical protein
MRPKERTHAEPTAAHGALAELATGQHGVVSTRQLLDLGYGPRAISRAAASGRLHRIHRGVYAVGHRNLTWHGRQLAAVLACAPNAVLSHASAGHLWGLSRNRPGSIHVTAPTRRHARASIDVHFAGLREEDRVCCDGVPVTAVPRTLLDLAAGRSGDRIDRLIERGEELGLLDLRSVEELLARAGGHRGVGPLRRALRLYREEPAFTRSGLERRFLRLVRGSGLPVPSMNCFVAGFELDAYWSRERFAVELDTYRHHGSPAAFERDRSRQEDLTLAGIEMIRVTGRRIADEPGQVIRRLAAHLERSRREVSSPPDLLDR